MARGQAESWAAGRTLEGGRRWPALLFGIHPLRVESGAWITERRDVLKHVLPAGARSPYLRVFSARLGGGRHPGVVRRVDRAAARERSCAGVGMSSFSSC